MQALGWKTFGCISPVLFRLSLSTEGFCWERRPRPPSVLRHYHLDHLHGGAILLDGRIDLVYGSVSPILNVRGDDGLARVHLES